MIEKTAGSRRAMALLALIAAGEMIFVLPFVLARVFRPTLLKVLEISNLQLGAAFSAYGIVAMVSYLAGGPLADRFPARHLMVVALLTTAAGGFLLAGMPDTPVLIALYGAWGMTTILLFWAALIRATREWGGAVAQGRAFGLLDAGRGLVAALLASAAVAAFAGWLPADPAAADPGQLRSAFAGVIRVSSFAVAATAVLVWVALPDDPVREHRSEQLSLHGLAASVRLPGVWLQALVILCAYTAYKATDLFSQYAQEVLAFDSLESAQVGAFALWLRPLGALAGGLLADRYAAPRATAWSFAATGAGFALLASGVAAGVPALFLLAVITGALGVYALRGAYFALTQEAGVPLRVTGSAVGIVSLIGFTPDVFAGPLFGWLLDASPGAAGHQQVYALVAVLSALGFFAAQCSRRINGSKQS